MVCGDAECAGEEDGQVVEFAGWEGDEDGGGDEEGVCGEGFEALEVGFSAGLEVGGGLGGHGWFFGVDVVGSVGGIGGSICWF